jgi:hypothetical protein
MSLKMARGGERRAVGRAKKCKRVAAALAVGVARLVLGCVPSEETTPLGYVVAPTVPPSDGGNELPDAPYWSPDSKSDARR